MIIAKSHTKIIHNGIPMSCYMQHALRLVLPDYRFNPTGYENCIKNKMAEVYPCCVYSNNSEIKPLGYITADDVKNSNVFNKLTALYNNLKYNNTLPGCFTNKNYESGKSYICNWNDKPLYKVIVSIQKTCNLKCKMCRADYVFNKEYDDFGFDILEQLKGHSIESLGLTDNGEPFFYKERTLSYLKNLDKDKDFKTISCISNLTLLSSNDIELLANINKNIKLTVTASIDGMTEETYRKIRGNNLFNKVLHNALELNKHGMLEQINFVVQNDNIHELLEAYEFWKNVNNVKFNAIPVNNNINDKEFNNIINREEYKKFIKIQNERK